MARLETIHAVKTVAGSLLWCIIAIWFWTYLVGNPVHELLLILRGHTAPGFIVDTDQEAEMGDEGATQWVHSAKYTFRLPDGRVMTAATGDRGGRLRDELRDLVNPVPVEVEYDPNDPSISRIKGDGNATVNEWLTRRVGLGGLLLAMFLAPGVFLFTSGIADWARGRDPLDLPGGDRENPDGVGDSSLCGLGGVEERDAGRVDVDAADKSVQTQ